MPKTIDALRERRGLISQDKPLNFTPQHIHEPFVYNEWYSHMQGCNVTEIKCKTCEYQVLLKHAKKSYLAADGKMDIFDMIVENEGEPNSKKINWK